MEVNEPPRIKLGIVGPIDLNLLNLEYVWKDMPTGNEYPIFSYLANALASKKYKLHIYTLSPNIIETKYYEDSNFKIIVIPKTDKSPLFYYYEISSLLRDSILKDPPDFIFSQWTYEYAWGAIRSKIKSTITVHDNAWRIFSINPSLNKLIKFHLNKYIISKAESLIAVSKYIFDTIPFEAKPKTRIITNFYPEYLDNIKIPYQNRRPYFITLCNGYGIRTNVKIAIEAFKIFNEKNIGNNFTYHLIGLGTESNSKLYEYALKIGAPLEKIKFHGYLSHPKVMETLRYATLLIHPSLEEANCISIIEAMALGVPVLGNKISPGVVEQLDIRRGMLFEENNAKSIVQKIELFLSDLTLQINMAQASIEYAKENYSQKLILEKLISYLPREGQSKAL